MSKTASVFTTAALTCAALISASAAATAQTYSPCSAKDYPGITFGSGAPTYAIGGTADGKCFCGVWTGISPQQAVQQGWYASCNNGKGICNFAPGTSASNQVCGPFK